MTRSLHVDRPGQLVLALAAAGAALAAFVACGQAPAARRVEPATAFEAQVLDDFKKRIDDYAALRDRLEADLPRQTDEATPEQIDSRERELGARLAKARANAKPGDLITEPMRAVIRQRFKGIFTKDVDGRNTRGSVMDENPVGTPIHVNQRYPDEVPLSTMPPEVLAFLPKLPPELEFRFVGRNLIILDARAHSIADYVADAIPE